MRCRNSTSRPKRKKETYYFNEIEDQEHQCSKETMCTYFETEGVVHIDHFQNKTHIDVFSELLTRRIEDLVHYI